MLLGDRDTLVAYSDGGLNAAAIEAGLFAREHRSKVIAVTLREKGLHLDTFVSPNVAGVKPGHNQEVFAKFRARCAKTESP